MMMKAPGMFLTGILATVTVIGCASTAPDRDIRMRRGHVYYLDGAGRGQTLVNHSSGVRQGLSNAGYQGNVEVFIWQTGLGVLADQTASESYKRRKATELARQIRTYMAQHPGAPVTIMGLSAGTVIAVFALEALPPGTSVQNVILLSGSLSADYNLTRALQRVSGKAYVFSSNKDAVLRFLVPVGGTADRAVGTTRTIGFDGIRTPRQVSADTRRQYAKVVEVAWNEEFKDYGNYGGHTDSVKASFVQAVVAPLVVTRPLAVAVETSHEAGEVSNPTYQRWARFRPGSWIAFEGHQIIDGIRNPIRARGTVMTVSPQHVIVDRVFEGLVTAQDIPPLTRRFFVTRTIDPANHPAVHPKSKTQQHGEQVVTIRGQRLASNVQTISATGVFPEWGANPQIEVYVCPQLPGGLARLNVKTRWGSRSVETFLEAVDYRIVK